MKYKQPSRGQLRLSSGGGQTLTNGDQYYHIVGVFSDGCGINFDLAADGTLIYTGDKPLCMDFGGTSDVESGNTTKVTYALFASIDEGAWALVPGEETPFDFEHANSEKNISITGLTIINPGTRLRVYAKAAQAGTVLTPATLKVKLVSPQ